MKNIDFELKEGGQSPLTEGEVQTLLKALTVVEKYKGHAVARVKLRVLWGLVRPSYAIRVSHFIPFLRWLVSDLSPTPAPADLDVNQETVVEGATGGHR